MWYGLSSILARFLNYLLTPYLTAVLVAGAYGEMSVVYAFIPFLNVLFTYGMETTFFRYSNKEEDQKLVFNTISLSVLFTTILFTGIFLLNQESLTSLLRLEQHPEFLTWTAGILALDTLTAIPYAKLRNDNRPRKYAFIRIAGILLNIGLVLFFYSVLPGLAAQYPGTFIASLWDPSLGAGYVILANLAQSALAFILLAPEFFSVRLRVDLRLWRKMMIYSLPIMIAGFGGMINETFDRLMLNWLAPVGSEEAAKEQVGIYSAVYKLSLLITLFIQAFRMGAEPFFFQQAKGENAPKTYARVMNYFVMAVCLMFLFVALYLDIWKQFIQNPVMWEGLKIVPVLLLANMFLGIYYNLSIWYKLSHKTSAGAVITFAGAAITVLINYFFIPAYGYVACAWATLACYGSMMLLSWVWGQKVYPVPYDVRKIVGYMVSMLLVFALHQFLVSLFPSRLVYYLSATLIFLGYGIWMLRSEPALLSLLPIRRFRN